MEVALIILLIVIAILDFMHVMNKKEKRVIIVYSALFSASLVLLLLNLFYPYTESIAGVILDIRDFLTEIMKWSS